MNLDDVSGLCITHKCGCTIEYIYNNDYHSSHFMTTNIEVMQKYPCPFCGSTSGIIREEVEGDDWTMMVNSPVPFCYRRHKHPTHRVIDRFANRMSKKVPESKSLWGKWSDHVKSSIENHEKTQNFYAKYSCGCCSVCKIANTKKGYDQFISWYKQAMKYPCVRHRTHQDINLLEKIKNSPTFGEQPTDRSKDVKKCQKNYDFFKD